MKYNSNKKVTTQDLATMMSAGFANVDKKFDEVRVAIKDSQEELGRMVASGFEQTASKKDIQRVDLNIERIDMRLDNLAPQFEVDDLKRRVTKLEKRTA